jgi:hypothetical protein
MARTYRRWVIVLVMGIWAGVSGCGHFPLLIGSAPVPIPVPPWVSERMQEKYDDRLKERSPILAPILPGAPLPTCEDPPYEEEMIRALPKVARGIPYIYQEFRDNYTFVVEKLVDQIDPPTFIPLVGPAQLHHCHYKCTIYYTQRIRSDYPFPFTVVNDKREEVLIDKDHLHLVAGPDERSLRSVTRDFAGPY